MATYKKGYKKQNPETILLKIIIGIIIGVFAFVGAAIIYDKTTEWKTYDYFTSITEYDGIFEYDNGEEEALEDYVVYFYATGCENCADIQNSILKDGKRINRDGEMFFLANVDSMTDEDENLEDFLDEIGETELGTPMMIVIVDGEFYEAFIGSSDCEEMMDTIADGDYEPFNN